VYVVAEILITAVTPHLPTQDIIQLLVSL